MKINIENHSDKLPAKFLIWLKTDLVCPECKREGMVVKYRCNDRIGNYHETSGIILACNIWDGKCQSKWNPINNGRHFPWHTWLSSFHIQLDIDRGRDGLNFLNDLKEQYFPIYKKLKIIDNAIEVRCRNPKPSPVPSKEIKTDWEGKNQSLANYN